MPKYQVDIPHSLAVDEAKQRISGATEKLQRDYGAACAWKGDSELTVSRKGLDARVIKNGIAKELSGILAARS
jgi:hypothetical protein